jgi:hypothetical protein
MNAASIAATPSSQRHLELFWLVKKLIDYCVRTSVFAVMVDGKAKLGKEKIGLKLCVAVTVT